MDVEGNRGQEDHINIRFSHSGSRATYINICIYTYASRIPETMFCQALVLLWAVGALPKAHVAPFYIGGLGSVFPCQHEGWYLVKFCLAHMGRQN